MFVVRLYPGNPSTRHACCREKIDEGREEEKKKRCRVEGAPSMSRFHHQIDENAKCDQHENQEKDAQYSHGDLYVK